MLSHRTSLVIAALLVCVGTGNGQTTHQVSTQSTKFTPKFLSISAGDSVQWNWTGGNLHTATEGTDDTIDPSDAFSYILDQFNPSATHLFDTKFLFEHPRPGHEYPYVCVPHAQFGMVGLISVDSPWTHLGASKTGALGAPLLYGDGPLTSGSAGNLRLEAAPPAAPAILFFGLVESGVAFKGGTLVPVPVLLQIDLVTDGAGDITIPFIVPPGVAGIPLFMQMAVADATASFGVAMSNATEALFR